MNKEKQLTIALLTEKLSKLTKKKIVLENSDYQVMSINDFSQGFADFYDFINKYHKNMDKDTFEYIKQAVQYLDRAWENEADCHGIEYQKYTLSEKLSKLTGKKVILKEGLSTMNLEEIMLDILDQSVWRAREWGRGLVKGCFSLNNTPFTHENVNTFFNWAQSNNGKQSLIKLLEENKQYLEWLSSDLDITEAIETAYDNEYGIFGSKALKQELTKITKQ